MPYKIIDKLPNGVKNNLPEHAQKIYKESFNSAFEQYSEESHEEREKRAHKIAWSAVKKKYERDGSGKWHKKYD